MFNIWWYTDVLLMVTLKFSDVNSFFSSCDLIYFVLIFLYAKLYCIVSVFDLVVPTFCYTLYFIYNIRFIIVFGISISVFKCSPKVIVFTVKVSHTDVLHCHVCLTVLISSSVEQAY